MANLAIPLCLVAWIALLLAGERFLQNRALRRSWLARVLLNLEFSVLTYVTAYCLVKPAIVAALDLTTTRGIGLLRYFRQGMIPELVFSFLFLDLTFYYWHRLNHLWPFLWRFHNVHHLDPDLDVTTAFRFHFVEVAFSTGFRFAQVVFLGISPWAMAFYEVVFQAATFFHHSNVRLPAWLDRLLVRVVVTPHLHEIHHSQRKEETNSNFSVVLNWWDKLHGTIRREAAGPVTIGVPGYDRPDDNLPARALLHPFRAQRPYWD